MADLPEAFIVHVSQGRVRVRIPAKKHDAEYFAQLAGFLVPLPGVLKVETNPVTGSVLVLHALELKAVEDLKAMSDYSQMMGLFKLASPKSGNASLGYDLAAGFAGLNQTVKGLTAEAVDLPTLSILFLVGVGIWQVSRGEVAVPAITALWYASSLMRDQWTNGKPNQSNVSN